MTEPVTLTHRDLEVDDLGDQVDPQGARLAVMTLRRPAARNAMDTAMLTALVDALDDCAHDARLRGLVVVGDGEHFSAGADVRETLQGDAARRRMELFTLVYEQLTDLPLPTAAAVEGYAVGGGAEVAAACDVRFAAAGARFRFPGARYGIPVGVARTTGLVGLGTAKDWVLSSRDVSAQEAQERGFVQGVVPDGEALPAAQTWLGQVAQRDAGTVRLLKQLFNGASGGLSDRVRFENDALRAQAETGRLPDLDRDLPRTVRPRR